MRSGLNAMLARLLGCALPRVLTKVVTSALAGAAMAAGLFTAIPALAQSSLPLPGYGDNVWKEMGITPPAYPAAAGLIKFPSSWTTSTVLIDGATLTIGSDNVVRYTLVIKTAGGAENVTYEGLRCETGQIRVYAFGRRDQTWVPARVSEWKPVQDTRINRHHFEFWRDVFCDGKVTEPRAQILKHVQRGGRERAPATPSD